MPQVCRTCFQEAADRNYIEMENDIQSNEILNKLLFCVPEVDLALTAKPIICILCVNLLNSAFTFKKQCLDTEQAIKKYMFGMRDFRVAELKDIYRLKKKQSKNIRIENGIPIIEPTRIDFSVADELNNLLDETLGEGITTANVVEPVVVKIDDDDDDKDDDVILLGVEDENLLVAKDSKDELQAEVHANQSGHEINDEDHNVNTVNEVVKKRRGKRPASDGTFQDLPTKDDDLTEPLPCEYCDFKSLKFDVLLAHVNCHPDKLKSEDEFYFCPLCKLPVRGRMTIINHKKMHNIYVEKRHSHRKKKRGKCDKCSIGSINSTI